MKPGQTVEQDLDTRYRQTGQMEYSTLYLTNLKVA